MYLLTTVGLQVMYLLCHNDSLTTVGLQVMLDSDCRAGVRSCDHSKTTALPTWQTPSPQRFTDNSWTPSDVSPYNSWTPSDVSPLPQRFTDNGWTPSDVR